MDKPSVWRAVVSSTDPRRPRSESSTPPGGGAHPDRPSSAMSYRLYDINSPLHRLTALNENRLVLVRKSRDLVKVTRGSGLKG
ncbi:hypothetical protein J4Q44_G00261860 [Coregonus suidteri]|uniref:Uncharacterized protein n=1 Tax=Coregonus suidteri TaxID=861788 RepID=A0AAN8L973_9TELE